MVESPGTQVEGQPELRIHLLGGLCLAHDGTPIDGVDTPRAQSLLAYLLLHRDAPQSRHHLAFLFWPDTSEMQALTNLRNVLHRLRHALPDADRFLQIDAKTLRWRADAPCVFDVADLEHAVAEARLARRAGDRAALRVALEKVVLLYRGDLLPSCYDDWVLSERERLRQMYTEVLGQLALLLEGQRDYAGAIAYAQRLLCHEPVHEATYRDLMRLYALNGDRAAALYTYHSCATVLQRELGVQPNHDTREAYERLLRTDTLRVPSSPAQVGRLAALPLIGRDREWAQLQEAWRAAVAGEPRLALLTGDAGIGKSRLAEELLMWAGRQGVITASARCYGAEGELPYAPVVTWLRAGPLPSLDDVWLGQVARLLPELRTQRPDLPAPGPLTEPWQRQSLFDALSRAVTGGGQPKLLLIDDLQWCDQDTLEWLRYLLHFDPLARLLVVGTMRVEESEGHGPQAALLDALRRSEQLIEIELGPLTESETLSLAARLVGTELDPALREPLYQASEGNPFFVVEMVRAGLSSGGTWGAEGREQVMCALLTTPPKVRTVIESRLAQLSPPAREVAGLAAAVGREFTYRLLAQASDGDESALVRSLDELWRRRIVREQSAETYDFGHERIREVAYAGLSATRRRLFHRRIAQAMEALHAGDLASVHAQVAAHYERAGLPERAISYYRRAAEAARALYSNQEAAGHYRRALALIGTVSSGEAGGVGHGLTAELYEGLGDVLALTAQHDDALAAYRDALEQAPGGEPIARARLQRKSGKIRETQRLYEEAGKAYDRAEAVLNGSAGDAGSAWWWEWAEIQVDRVWLHYWQGHLQEMSELAGRARPAVEQYGAPAQRFRFQHSLFLMALWRDRFLTSDRALDYAREMMAASQELGDLSQIVWAHFALGFAHLWRADYEEGEQALQAALALAERSGDVVLQSRCLAYLSVLYRRRGQVEQARHYNARGLDVATAAQMPEYVAIAKANLAWLAWRARKLSEVVDNSLAALAIWRTLPLAFAFCWTALCPLIGVMLAMGRRGEAIDYARELVEPAQMRLPDALAEAIGQAVQAWERGDATVAHGLLANALSLAQQAGYL